jgi:hypothetical protein
MRSEFIYEASYSFSGHCLLVVLFTVSNAAHLVLYFSSNLSNYSCVIIPGFGVGYAGLGIVYKGTSGFKVGVL